MSGESGASELRVPGGCDLAPPGTPIRRQTEDTAEALAGRQRWADVLTLTDGLAQEVGSLPSGLMRLRAEALRRAGRGADARELLVRGVKGNRADQRTDPATLYQLADLLAADGDFDVALKLVARAWWPGPIPSSPSRPATSASASSRWRSGWRSPPRSTAARHLLHFEDFRAGYSPGLDVLGLYDGKIRAPHWFQEGLAQHVEMLPENVNPIQGYRDKGNLLGFPLLEPAIGSLSPALVAIGYDESRWTLHYVEHRYGRAGKTTGEALAALGTTTAQFDHDLWQWGVTDAPAVWKVELVRYDRE